MNPLLIERLRAIVGDGGLVQGRDVQDRFPGYFMPAIAADAVVRPTSTEQVSQILKLCNAERQRVVVHGGMSGWVRATSTEPGDLVISLERMNCIESVDVVNRTAVVQAGVILETLQNQLLEKDLSFPLDLGGRGSCHLGGNAATNAGGMRVIRYGMMREQVLGIEAVLADGTVVSSLNRLIKNNTGYDLKQLFIGSEGTLGVITKLVLRLREQPKSCSTALVSTDSFEKIVQLLRHMDGALGGLLSAFELMDQRFYEVNTATGRHEAPLARQSAYYVVIEALGADQARDDELFEHALTQALEKLLVVDATIAHSERERQAIWAIREDLAPIVRDFAPLSAFDVSLSIGDMEQYLRDVRTKLLETCPGAQLAIIGHVGDNNLHIAIGAGGKREFVESAVYEPLRAIGGSVSAEHGIGLEKKPWLAVSRNPIERSLMLALKKLLDPNGILNPGKIFDIGSAG